MTLKRPNLRLQINPIHEPLLSNGGGVIDICLINPPTTNPGERSFYFPMALLTLGGVLKSCGAKAELWDFDLFYKKAPYTREQEFRRMISYGVKGRRSPIFGISSICSNLPMALWIAREIKRQRSDALVIFGGPQPSSIPGPLLDRFPFVDLIAIGEGEETLRDLVEARFRVEAFSSIPGLAFRRDGQVCFSPKRELVTDMDSLPSPDYGLIDFSEYVAMHGGSFMPNVEVGRGVSLSM